MSLSHIVVLVTAQQLEWTENHVLVTVRQIYPEASIMRRIGSDPYRDQGLQDELYRGRARILVIVASTDLERLGVGFLEGESRFSYHYPTNLDIIRQMLLNAQSQYSLAPPIQNTISETATYRIPELLAQYARWQVAPSAVKPQPLEYQSVQPPRAGFTFHFPHIGRSTQD